MAIFGPTQNWLKNVTNDISIQEFHNIITHYKPHYTEPNAIFGNVWKVHKDFIQHPYTIC